jgi:hypothetical protein
MKSFNYLVAVLLALGIPLSIAVDLTLFISGLVVIMACYCLYLIVRLAKNKLLLSARGFFIASFSLSYYYSYISLWITEPDKIKDPLTQLIILAVIYVHIMIEIILKIFKRPPPLSFKISNAFNKIELKPAYVLPVIALLTVMGVVSWRHYFSAFGGVSNFMLNVFKQEPIGFSGVGWAKSLSNSSFYASVLLFWVCVLDLKKKSGVKYYSLLAGFIIYTLSIAVMLVPYGGRGNILIIFLLLIIIYNYRVSRVSLKMILVVFSVLLTLAYVGKIYRDYMGRWDKGTKNLMKESRSTKILKSGFGFDDFFWETYNIIEGVPSLLDYQYGKTYITVFAMMVPRKIWPEKWICAGAMFTQKILQKNKYSGIGHSTPTAIGEAYLNFSIFGVILLPFLLGNAIRCIDGTIEMSKTPAGVIITAYLMRFPASLVTGDFSVIMMNHIEKVLGIVMCFMLMYTVLPAIRLTLGKKAKSRTVAIACDSC